MELDRARMVCEVSQTIINSAKVEVELVKAVSGSAPGSTAFFNMPEESRQHPKIAAASGVREVEAWAKPKDGAA